MKLLAPGSRINHPEHGKGVVTNVTNLHYYISFIESGIETIPLDDEFEIIEALDYELDLVSFYEVETSLKKILQRWSDITPTNVKMGDRWNKGKLILEPGQAGVSSKEIPIDTFFHKIVMVRDRLRVMEQKINASDLDDAAKVDLQQYITRIYGSLTTFNVLFRDKEDHFVGSRSRSWEKKELNGCCYGCRAEASLESAWPKFKNRKTIPVVLDMRGSSKSTSG